MKKLIASDQGVDMNKATEYFVGLLDEKFYHCGYTVTGEGVLPNLKLTVACTNSRPKFMPIVELDVEEYESNTFGVIPKLSFPVLDQHDMTYSDDLVHWTSEWTAVAATAAAVYNDVYFCPDDYDEFI